MFKECPVTNDYVLPIKGTSRAVSGDIFPFLEEKKKHLKGEKKTLHPLSPAERVTLCVVPLPASEIHNAYQSMMRHEISGGRQMTCHFCRVSSLSRRPMHEYPHRTNLICDWTGHHLCERHHLSVKRSHAACEIWWEETKGREREKKNKEQNKFSMAKKQEGNKENLSKLFPLSLSFCFILL